MDFNGLNLSLTKKTITIIGEDKVVIVFYLLVAYFCL